MTDRIVTRRQLLLGAAGIVGAAGAASLGGLDLVQSASGATATSLTRPPSAPPGHQSYISRPDISPPGVSIEKVAGFASRPGQPQYFFLSPRVAPGGVYPKDAQQGLMILDLDGHLVWWKALDATDTNPFNLRVQTYQGKPALTWFRGTVNSSGVGTGGAYVIADDTYTQVAAVTAVGYPSDLHEFLLTDDGTALVTAYEERTEGSSSLYVSHAQEVDLGTNDLVFDWASYPTVGTASTYVSGADYFHINSIDLWPGTRDYLISSRNTCAVYLIDKTTKKVIWRLGGRYSTFAMGTGTPFYFQHDARPLADGSGISLFDDASQPNVGGQRYAAGKVLNLDQKGYRATLRHAYYHSTDYLPSGSQGNNQLLPSGGHLVGFGALPYFSVFAASGNVVQAPIILDGRLPSGVDSYRVLCFDWVGNPPTSEIALVVYANSPAGHFTAHASWNGATEVASWRLAAGPSASDLTPVTPVARQGFETAIPVTHTGAAYFQATALDAAGSVLGASAVVGPR